MTGVSRKTSFDAMEFTMRSKLPVCVKWALGFLTAGKNLNVLKRYGETAEDAIAIARLSLPGIISRFTNLRMKKHLRAVLRALVLITAFAAGAAEKLELRRGDHVARSEENTSEL